MATRNKKQPGKAVRLSAAHHAWLVKRAEVNRRSLTGELEVILEQTQLSLQVP
jgi:hypothetical protein